MSQIIWGIIGIAVGSSFVIKTEWYLSFAGRVAFAEKYLGVEGGTRLFYKLLGLLIIFFSFTYMTGLTEELFGGLVRSILFIK